MPARLPVNIRSDVIQQWLAGYPRDRIAFECGISAGAASGIISDWRLAVDYYDPDALRDLGVYLTQNWHKPRSMCKRAQSCKDAQKIWSQGGSVRIIPK